MKHIGGAVILFFICLFAYTKLVGPIPFSINSVTTTKTDTFTVSGTGKSTIVPDTAHITVGVQANGATVKQIQQDLNTKMNKVAEAVKNLGVDKNDIQTTNYSIYPTHDYRDGNQRITGYQASTNLSIKVRNIDRANDVIDQATANGANQVGGITFEPSDKSKAETEARQKAVEEAKTKATQAAQTAGFKLGRVINYNENFAGLPVPVPMYDRAMMGGVAKADSAPTQVQPGSNEITVTVALSYEIE